MTKQCVLVPSYEDKIIRENFIYLKTKNKMHRFCWLGYLEGLDGDVTRKMLLTHTDIMSDPKTGMK